MHLSCPNCGAEYEVPDSMVATAGRHVQCTACHTRWFVRGEAKPAVSEDQILHRLETWSPRRRPVAVPDIARRPPVEAEPEDVDLTSDDEAEPAPPVAAPPEPPRRDPPTKPAERPTVSRPATVVAAPAPAGAPRPAPRLDLGEPARPRSEQAAEPRSRFFRGFLIAFVAFLLAFGAYRFGDAIAARVPAAAPALDGYEGFVDGLRVRLYEQIDALRERTGQGSEQVQ